MSAMYASLFPEHLKNLILMTAPVEFPEGEMGSTASSRARST